MYGTVWYCTILFCYKIIKEISIFIYSLKGTTILGFVSVHHSNNLSVSHQLGLSAVAAQDANLIYIWQQPEGVSEAKVSGTSQCQRNHDH